MSTALKIIYFCPLANVKLTGDYPSNPFRQLHSSQSPLRWLTDPGKDLYMDQEIKGVAQPKPFTPGMSPGQVRQHAYELFRDKLDHAGLTLEDWVLAEKDLVQMQQVEQPE
jgi:hypothetical protein